MPDFDYTLPVVPDKSIGKFPDTTQTYTHAITGLPYKIKGQLVDKLFRIFSQHGLKNEASTIRTFVVPKGGKILLSGLRDSMYDLIITTPGYAKYNQYDISIGDPNKFNTVNRFTEPSPAEIRTIDVGTGIDQVPYAKVTWELSARGQTGMFKLEYRVNTSTTWITAQDAMNTAVRTFTIGSLEYSQTYNFRLLTQTQDGSTRGISQVKSATTPDAPEGMVDNAVVIDGGTGFMTQFGGGEVQADTIRYTDDETVESLQPAEAGSDVTNDNTADDTDNVNSVSATVVQAAAQAIQQVWSADESTNDSTGSTYLVIHQFYYIFDSSNVTLKWATEGLVNGIGTGNIKIEIFDITGVTTKASATVAVADLTYTAKIASITLSVAGLIAGTTYRVKIQINDDAGITLTTRGGTCYLTKA